MRSTDFRFEDAAGDIWQHRVNSPQDWDDGWVFHDERFHVLHADDERSCASSRRCCTRSCGPTSTRCAGWRTRSTRRSDATTGSSTRSASSRASPSSPDAREAYHAAPQVLSVDAYPRLAMNSLIGDKLPLWPYPYFREESKPEVPAGIAPTPVG